MTYTEYYAILICMKTLTQPLNFSVPVSRQVPLDFGTPVEWNTRAIHIDFSATEKEPSAKQTPIVRFVTADYCELGQIEAVAPDIIHWFC